MLSPRMRSLRRHLMQAGSCRARISNLSGAGELRRKLPSACGWTSVAEFSTRGTAWCPEGATARIATKRQLAKKSGLPISLKTGIERFGASNPGSGVRLGRIMDSAGSCHETCKVRDATIRSITGLATDYQFE